MEIKIEKLYKQSRDLFTNILLELIEKKGTKKEILKKYTNEFLQLVSDSTLCYLQSKVGTPEECTKSLFSEDDGAFYGLKALSGDLFEQMIEIHLDTLELYKLEENA